MKREWEKKKVQLIPTVCIKLFQGSLNETPAKISVSHTEKKELS